MAEKKARSKSSEAVTNGFAQFITNNAEVSAADIARLLGKSSGFISQIKSGKRDLPVNHALKPARMERSGIRDDRSHETPHSALHAGYNLA
jgi:hypothetical protein